MFTEYWLKMWSSNSLHLENGQRDVRYIWYYAILVVLVIIIGALRGLFWFKFSRTSSKVLHMSALWSMIHSPLSFFTSNPSGICN